MAVKKREKGEGNGRMKGRGWRRCGRRLNEEEGRPGGITGRVRQWRCRRAGEGDSRQEKSLSGREGER